MFKRIKETISVEMILRIIIFTLIEVMGLVFMYRHIGDEVDPVLYVASGTSIAVVLLTVFTIIYSSKHDYQLWKLYLITSIVLGLVYVLFIPTYVTPDEPTHMYEAYRMSDRFMGIQHEKDHPWLMRQDDINLETSGIINTMPGRYELNRYYWSLTNVFADDTTLVDGKLGNYGGQSYLYYIPALGITIGRLFHLYASWTYILGTLFNLALFIATVTFCLRIIPFGKEVLYIWALLPMTLQQVASFSYDCPTLSFSILFVTLSLYFFYSSQPIKLYHVLAFVLSGVLLIPVKGSAYALICFVPVILALSKTGTRDIKKKYWKIMWIFPIFFALLQIWIKVHDAGLIYDEKTINGVDTYHLAFILEHPFETIGILIETIANKGDFYLGSLVGTNLGWFQIPVANFVVYPFFFLLALAAMKKTGEAVFLNAKAKIGFLLIAFVCIGFSMIGMMLCWTPAGSSFIDGVQGRYFLPVLPLILLCLRNDNLVINDTIVKKIIQYVPLFNMLVMTYAWARF